MRRLAAVLISAATLGAAGLTAATSADASSGFLSVLRHDAALAGRSSGFHTSVYVGPLSALDYDRGLANAQGSAFQRNPPLFAATRLRSALGADHIQVSGGPTTGRTPANALELVEVRSPTISRVLQIMD